MKRIHLLALSLFTASVVTAQTTISNMDFNSASSYPVSGTTTTNITASLSSTETFTTFTGANSGSSAFTTNATAGNAIAMANSSGTDTKYWTLTLGGSDLNKYTQYKLYLQAQRSGTGATTITVAYSTNGSSYTTLTTMSPGNGSYAEAVIDASAITALNNQASVYFKLSASGASGTGTLRIDNLQIQAVNNPLASWSASGSNITTTGNIGIGTTSPAAPLDVIGNARVTGTFTTGTINSSNISNSGKISTAGNFSVTGTSNLNGNTSINGALTTNSASISSLANSSNEFVYADANGNLKTGPISLPGTNPFEGTIGYWNLRGNSQTDTTFNFIGTTDDKDFIFKTNNVERMRITSHATNNKEQGRVYIGGGDLITQQNDLPGNWDDKLIIKDAIRVVNDNLTPSKCALFGNDGANTYIESFNINQPDEPGSPWYASPDGILMGWYSGANVAIGYQGTGQGGNLSVQNEVSIGGNIGIGSDNSSSNSQIHLRGLGDSNHGLGWFNTYNNGTTSTSINGPVLYGYEGGALASKQVSGSTTNTKVALKWDANGNIILPNYTSGSNPYQTLLVDASGNLVRGAAVANTNATDWTMGGNASAGANFGTTDANSDLPIITAGVERMRISGTTGNIIIPAGEQITLRDANHGLGYYDGPHGSSGLPGFAGKDINGPVLYGFSGGALGSNQFGTQNIALQWDAGNSVAIGGNVVSGYQLAVYGKIIAPEVVVKLLPWPDYVFTKNYKLKELSEVENYINQNHHLPNIPSAQEVEKSGVQLGEMVGKQMEKIEEITLYLIEMKKQLEKQNQEIEQLKKENKELKNSINNK